MQRKSDHSYSRKVSYMFFIPEYGRFTAAIDTTESICRFTAATSDELTTLLEDPDAMVISLDGNLEIDAPLDDLQTSIPPQGASVTISPASVTFEPFT